MDLAPETAVGLPRSSLVKSKSSDAPSPVAVPMPPVAVIAPPVAVIAPPVAVFAPVEASSARDSFRTKADSIEVQMESQRAPGLASPPDDVMRAPYASGPSSSELLERAAALGPARMTWESIVLPADPILDEKRLPHVAERRARLTRVVKIALGACVGVCVLALGVSAVSGDSSPPPASAASSVINVGKTVASKGIVPVEQLEGTKRAKAVRRTAPAVTTAAIVRGNKRR